MMGFWFFITQYLQTVKGYSPLEAGIAFLPMTVVNFAGAISTPGLTRRFGNGALLAAGVALTMIGMFWLSRLSADTSLNVAHQLGGSLGLGVLVTLFAAANATGLDTPHLFAHGSAPPSPSVPACWPPPS